MNILAPATIQDISKLPEKLVNCPISVIKIASPGTTKMSLQEPTFISILMVEGKDLDVHLVAPFKKLKTPDLTLKRLYQKGTNNLTIKYDESVPLEAYLIMEAQAATAKKAESTLMPSFGTQAVNFAVAVKDHIKNRVRQASEEEIKKRAESCNACEYLSKTRCTKCGCFVANKQKWESSRCPDNRW